MLVKLKNFFRKFEKVDKRKGVEKREKVDKREEDTVFKYIPDILKLYDREFDNRDIDTLHKQEEGSYAIGGYTHEGRNARNKFIMHDYLLGHFMSIYRENLRAIFNEHYRDGNFTIYDQCYDLNKIDYSIGVEVSDEHIEEAKLLIEKYNKMDIEYSVQNRTYMIGGGEMVDPILREVYLICRRIEKVFTRSVDEYVLTISEKRKVINIAVDCVEGVEGVEEKAKEIMNKYVDTTSLIHIGWTITYDDVIGDDLRMIDSGLRHL